MSVALLSLISQNASTSEDVCFSKQEQVGIIQSLSMCEKYKEMALMNKPERVSDKFWLGGILGLLVGSLAVSLTK